MNPSDATPRYATDRKSLEKDCMVEFISVGGPGGQHRNRNATGVRLRHLPTGIVVTATERRSQLRNLETAFDRICARLEILNRPRKKRRPTRPSASSRKARLNDKRVRGRVKMLRRDPNRSE